MIPLGKEVAEKILEKYIIKHNTTYHGIPVSEFNKEELLKIIDVLQGFITQKDKTVDLLSRI